ncbi:MAG TPA: HAMP domain-containing sensor histidine kinase [Chitinophagaceae bacterium]|jgi:signal transduction histidine kinase|nr:HAMP domain-containing sensor histidine kinase [Chitinophagaceae bacterium]
MIKQFTGWKGVLAILAILIIAATLLYVSDLSHKMQHEERMKMQTWVEAGREILTAPQDANLNLATEIIANNTTIPIIQVDKDGHIISTNNLDSEKVAHNPGYPEKMLNLFKTQHPPITQQYNPKDSTDRNFIYYGDSKILQQIRYYPYIQLGVVALFIIVTLIALGTTNRSTQNQLWVGLAKETAHQLGTPLSSMEAWLELLKERKENEAIVGEMGRDLDRLKLISERFSKIGSTPELEEHELISQIHNVVAYMKRRAPQKIRFIVKTHGEEDIPAMISPLLFDWVIENLLKNALDAMGGKGSISIDIVTHTTHTWIDITDTGKGITNLNMDKVFKPGFSTKKRGWGLGLSLSKRIIEGYHKGRIFVKSSEVNKGTTFRIMLRK